MSHPVFERLKVVDDFLFDRIYQPIADRAAEFEIKCRHLGAGCEVGAAVTVYFGDYALGLHWIRFILPAIFISLAYIHVYWHILTVTNIRDILINYRLLFVITSFILITIPPESISSTILFICLASAQYFLGCQDKPPRRRRGREIKAKLEEMFAWQPPVSEPARGS